MHRRTPYTLAALLGAAAAIATAHAEPRYSPGKIPVLIVPGEVSIDGLPRPDLGRSFSDTISSGLLRSGSFTVVDPEIGKREPAEDMEQEAPSPEQVAASLGTGIGAHYVFVPRMVVEEDYNKFTLKKIRVSDGEVVDVYERSKISLDRSTMFELLDESMRLVYTDITRDARERRKAEASVGDALDPDPLAPAASTSDLDAPPQPLERPPLASPTPAPKTTGRIREPAPRETTEPAERAPTARAAAKPARRDRDTPPDVAGAEEPKEVVEYAGRVRAVNTDWHFCIIEAAKRGMLKVDDELLVRSSTRLEPLGKLRVSKVEGSQVVADPLGGLSLDAIRAGYKVYRWTPVE